MTNHLHQALRLAGYVLLLALGLALLPAALPSAAPGASAMEFNPTADLDTSHVQDLRRTPALIVVPDPDVETVTFCTQAAPFICVPDESPDGGALDLIYEDGTAEYHDDWSISPTFDVTNARVIGDWDSSDVSEAAELNTTPTDAQPALTSAQRARYGTDEYGPCGTDAQCAAYAREVLHEEPTGYAT